MLEQSSFTNFSVLENEKKSFFAHFLRPSANHAYQAPVSFRKRKT